MLYIRAVETPPPPPPPHTSLYQLTSSVKTLEVKAIYFYGIKIFSSNIINSLTRPTFNSQCILPRRQCQVLSWQKKNRARGYIMSASLFPPSSLILQLDVTVKYYAWRWLHCVCQTPTQSRDASSRPKPKYMAQGWPRVAGRTILFTSCLV